MGAFLSTEFCNTLLRFLICVVVNWSIIYFLYNKKSQRRDFTFTFMIMTVAIFFLVYFMMGMDRGKATMGVGLGLFGIFSIMRYRTDTMPVREMTYLFVIICLSVVHAMATESDDSDATYTAEELIINFTELIIVDIITFLAVFMCEKMLKTQPSRLIQYDRIELIVPERREELIADLEKRMGIKITKVEIGALDFLRDMAMIRVSYEGEATSVGSELKLSKNQLKDF